MTLATPSSRIGLSFAALQRVCQNSHTADLRTSSPVTSAQLQRSPGPRRSVVHCVADGTWRRPPLPEVSAGAAARLLAVSEHMFVGGRLSRVQSNLDRASVSHVRRQRTSQGSFWVGCLCLEEDDFRLESEDPGTQRLLVVGQDATLLTFRRQVLL
jgi:hypothetical protein